MKGKISKGALEDSAREPANLRKRPSLERGHTYLGKVFGRLTVIEVLPKKRYDNGTYSKVFRCKCDCGNEKVTVHTSLACGRTRSCGCLKKEQMSAQFTTHGESRGPTHRVWAGMLSRARGTSQPQNYADRGIGVDPRWEKFDNFLEDMGERPKGKSLDRIDNDGPYAPWNCRWADSNTQQRNRRDTVKFEFEGKLVAAADLAERFGIKLKTLKARVLRFGYTVEEALTKPVVVGHPRKK